MNVPTLKVRYYIYTVSAKNIEKTTRVVCMINVPIMEEWRSEVLDLYCQCKKKRIDTSCC